MEPIDLHRPCLTRAALLRWSAFRLPRAAGKRRTVPALTLEQFRNFERRGCFDPYRFHGTATRPVVVWKPRKHGATALYSLYDVAVVRLIGWMLTSGVSNKVIVNVLRGSKSMGRAVMDARTADYAVIFQDGAGLVLSERGRQEFLAYYHRYAFAPAAIIQEFPLAWLGMRGTLPRIRKEIGKAPTVPLWNRRVPLEVGISAQAEAR